MRYDEEKYRGVLVGHDGSVRYLGDDGFAYDPAELLEDDQDDE